MSGADRAGPRLARALRAAATGHGITLTIDRHDETGWRSATFTGTRHDIRGRIAGSAAAMDRWCGLGSDPPIAIPGHMLTALSIETGADGAIRLSAETVADSI